MDPTPFWSSPEFTKAMTTAAAGLATLIGSIAMWFAAQAIYRRVLAARAKAKGERAVRYRRAEDGWRDRVDTELGALRAEIGKFRGEVDERFRPVERGLVRLLGRANLLKRKVDAAGDAMAVSAKDMAVTREQLARFMGEQETHREWLKEQLDEVKAMLRGDQ